MEQNFLKLPIKWVWVMRKLNTPLSVSSYPIGSILGAEMFGFPQHLTATWYDHGDIYFDEGEMEQLRQFIRYKIQLNSDYPSMMARKVFSLAKTIEHQPSLKPGALNVSLPKLITIFQREQKLFLKMIGFMSYRGSIQISDVLREKIATILSYRLAQKGNLNSLEDCLEKLSISSYQSVVADEKEYALRQAIDFKELNLVAQSARVQSYLEKYSWLSYHWFVGTPPIESDVKTRFLQLAPTALAEIEKIKQLQKQNEQHVRKAVRELGFNLSEKKLLQQYREWIFLRTFIKDSINLAGYKLLPILAAIANHIKVQAEDIVFLTLEEILNINKLHREKIIQKIEERRNGFSAGIINSKLQFRSFVKPSAVDVVSIESSNLKGQTACKGKIRGAVRVVLFPKEQHKLKQGEILVTSMTTPDFLPCMERAAAFVTDEGGITCHAAIVAREMNKPCLIGTKTATKILKDGDLIEVNATNGFVKKIVV